MTQNSKKRRSTKSGTPKNQARNFVEAARALGCDEDPAHFDAALKKVARHKPADRANMGTKTNQKDNESR